SSVVSVLISLISDTWAIGPHDIKLISLRGGPNTVACYWGLRASPLRCTAALAWRTLQLQFKMLKMPAISTVTLCLNRKPILILF
ncbi:hypothetical protein PRUPE_1G232200, partial [Prunus persica]